MNTLPHPKFTLRFMKRFALIASLLALPLAATAQFTVFTDNFTSGSTTNHTSIPGGTPFASFTSYDVAATKTVLTNTTITPGDLKIAIDGTGTGSGLLEVQAVFTKSPIILANIGDYVNLTYIFRMTNPLPTTSAYLGQGLYNSGGVPPAAGSLNNSGLSGSGLPTGNCQLWQGIYSRIFSNANSVCISRPMQTGAGVPTSANQDLLGTGVTGGFNNPPGGTLSGTTNAGVLTLIPGSYYTISFTITLADTNTPTLTMTNILYDGAGTAGTALFVMTNVATDTNFMTSFDSLALGRRDTGGSGIVPIMDITNITISENILGVPSQPFNVTGGGQGCAGDTFPVGLNGSAANNNYYLFTNGVWNGSIQPGTGSALSFPLEAVITVPLTNTVIASNTISGFTGPMLGSVLVTPAAPPSITNQPIPVIVANGSIAVFRVGATGGGLTYQWNKNGAPLSDSVGHISGATTPTLVISPVGAGDAATTAQGYYAVVTSGCAVSSQTITNSLTINSPANITWQGGNPNTNWDLTTTPNFTSGASSVVFHNGDNVTFDDSSTVPILSIADNYIAPTLITASASGVNYTFTGPGVIQGPGAILKSGTASLSLNNSNAYSGGTTISGGMLILSNQFAAGVGPLTLSGGTLDIPIAFGSAVGVSNNVNVTTDSTLQYDKSGTFALVLDGAITGSSSKTLTINAVYNLTIPSTARMRMYGAFTNNANLVLNSPGQTEIEMAPYLPSGNQVFNGVISGIGGHFVPRGAGSVIFNNTNTFNDSGVNPPSGYSLFMSSGNVGIGADSVSSTPPTIDASPVGTGIVGINVGAEGGTCAFFASGGAHTIANPFTYTSATNTVTVVFGGVNNLTLSGTFTLSGADNTGNTNRTLQVTNNAATTISGVITDNGLNVGIIKTGNGTLYLNGVNTYNGPTTNNAGVLAGTGTIVGPVDVETNGSIGGGSATAIGTLTVNNALTLNGNVSIRVNKALSPSQSNDVVSVSGALSSTGIGTLTVSNAGAALVVGDKFKVFNKAVSGAGAMTITGGGMNWANNLAVDGSITATSANTGPATNPTNIVFSVSSGNLSMSWPADHLGWFLQTSTNLLSNWVDVAGSSTVTNVVIPIDKTAPRSFYRMSLQP